MFFYHGDPNNQEEYERQLAFYESMQEDLAKEEYCKQLAKECHDYCAFLDYVLKMLPIQMLTEPVEARLLIEEAKLHVENYVNDKHSKVNQHQNTESDLDVLLQELPFK